MAYAPIFDYSRSDVVVAWGLSLPQAATTLAVVLVGHDQLSLFNASVLNATIVMVLVTCMLGRIGTIGSRRIAAEINVEEEEQGDDELSAYSYSIGQPESSEHSSI